MINKSVAAARFFINSIEKWCRESNILTSSAAFYKMPNIIYLKTIKYLKIRLRQMYQMNLELKISFTKDSVLNAVL